MSAFIYFARPIGAEGPVKIGCSKVPLRRLEALMVWSPVPLEIAVTFPGNFTLERNIHECFFDQRSHQEWFFPSKRLTDLIDALKNGAALADVLDLSDRRGKMSSYVVTQEYRRYMSYCHRVSWLHRRRRGQNYYFSLPSDALHIIDRWRSWEGKRLPKTPTPEEFARLEEVLANPEKHCQKRFWVAQRRAREAA